MLTLAAVSMTAAAGCAMDAAPGGEGSTEPVSRAAEADSTGWTPWRGGSGGNSAGSIFCPSGTVVVGLYGRSAVYQDQIGLMCAGFDQYGLLLPAFRGPAEGSQGGEPDSELLCPNGAYAIGVQGNSHTYVDDFGLICQFNGEVWIGTGLGGQSYWDVCPGGSNRAVAGVYLHWGSWIDGETSYCVSAPPN
jgi:hypothetical protein